MSVANSTTIPLLANQTFTGEYEDAISYSSFCTSIKTDQLETLYVENSMDGVIADRILMWSITDITTVSHFSLSPRARYVRIRYINGAIDQTTLEIQTGFSTTSKGASYIPVSYSFKYNSTVLQTKSTVSGRLTTGDYIDIESTDDRRLKISPSRNNLTFTDDKVDISGSSITTTISGTADSIEEKYS